MTAVSEQTTVGEVASTVPASVRVFQEFGIDFCCGGGKTLIEACREKGVSVEQVLAAVQKAEQRPHAQADADWKSESLTRLIDHILEKHHAYLHTELPRLGNMVARVIEVHGPQHADSLHPLGNIYAQLRRELEEHMWKEENILFPLIKRMEAAYDGASDRPLMPVDGPIRMMEIEHEAAGNALQEMRQVTAGYQAPEDACNTYRALFHGLQELEADLHQHIHLENNILFPRALEL